MFGSKKIKKKVQIQKTETVTTIPEGVELYNEVRYIVVPPDGGWGWFVVTASFLSNFVADGVMYTFGIFLEDISRDLHSKPSQITLANSICTGLYFVVGPLVCAMTNRLGFRTVAVTGGVMGSCGFIITSFASGKLWFIISYGVISGFAFCMCYIPSILAIGFYFERWRAIATSVAVCGSSVGVFVFPPIFKILLSDYNWRFKYRILAALLFICGFLGFIYKPIIPIKLIQDDKTSTSTKNDERYSLTSVSIDGENLKSIFYKKHNAQFPTNADLVGKLSINPEIQKPDRTDKPTTSVSRSSFKSFKSFKSLVVRSSWGTIHSEKVNMNTIYEDEDQETCRFLPLKCCSRCRFNCSCVCQTGAPSRPMYRDDIFFAGSYATLSKYSKATLGDTQSQRKHSNLEQSIDYNLSVTRMATKLDLEQDQKCCVCCPEAVVRTLATMLDFSLLKSPAFVMLVISGFFTFLGIYIPYIYLSAGCIANGMDKNVATYLLSAIGIANTVGRITCGIITFLPRLSVLTVTIVGLFVAGSGTIVSVHFSNNTIAQFSYASIFGLFTACVPALRSILAVEMVGLEKLTNAFGLIVLSEGVACMIGTPVSSVLMETYKSYYSPMLFAGVSIIISAVLLIPIPKLIAMENRKRRERVSFEKARRDQQHKEALVRANASNQGKQHVERTKKKY